MSYGNSNRDLETPLAIIGGDPFGTAATSTDSDALELSGTWYYSGLSDSEGPKSRAAFLSRASSASLAFSYIDESISISSTGLTSPPLPPGLPTSLPSSGSLNDTSRELKADLRHVWQSSGWYGLAGVDRSAHYAGVGKYLGDATALDFRVTAAESGGLDATGYALDRDSYEGFAGWFVRDDIELRAWYEDNDFGDSPFAELDSNQFGIGVNVRF